MCTFGCGLDAHKDSTYATILDSDGKMFNQVIISSEKVLSYLSQAMESPRAHVVGE